MSRGELEDSKLESMSSGSRLRAVTMQQRQEGARVTRRFTNRDCETGSRNASNVQWNKKMFRDGNGIQTLTDV